MATRRCKCGADKGRYSRGYCNKCHREWMQARRDRFIAEGRCSQCGKEPRPGMRICERCARVQSRSKHTTEERAALMSAQHGRCAVCQNEFSRTPHGDHNHITKEKRGLLCSRCNHLVGHIETRPWLIDAAYNYLGVSA